MHPQLLEDARLVVAMDWYRRDSAVLGMVRRREYA